MFLSTNQPVGYLSIKHLTLILEETTKGVSLNQPANEPPLTQNNYEELIFPDVHTFVRHVDEEAYKHLAARSKISAQKPFATAKEIFEVLQKAYGNVN